MGDAPMRHDLHVEDFPEDWKQRMRELVAWRRTSIKAAVIEACKNWVMANEAARHQAGAAGQAREKTNARR